MTFKTFSLLVLLGVLPISATAGFLYKRPIPGLPPAALSAPQSEPAECELPWGGRLAHGATVTAYQTDTASDCSSAQEARVCTDGVLSGSYTRQACVNTEYATYNPADKGYHATLSNGNLTVSIAPTAQGVRGTIGKSSGKWYWEVTEGNSSIFSSMLGIADSSAYLHGAFWNRGGGVVAYYGWNGTYFRASGQPQVAAGCGAWDNGAVIGVALDADNKRVRFYRNGAACNEYYYGGEFTGPAYPFAAEPSGDVAQSSTANFGQRPFTHPVPAGYQPGLW